MKRIIDNYPIALLVIIGIGLFAFNLDDLQVTIMEARNFIVAREMITENHWLLTTMNNIPRYEKPPFPAWFTTPFAFLFGLNNDWAYRMPTSIFAIIGLVYFFKLIKIWLTKEIAFYATLILGTSFYYVVIRFEAPSDIYTHVSMIIAIYFLVRDHPQIKIKNMILGGLLLGVSILSKGPVSLYTLFLPFILAYIFSFQVQLKSLILGVFGLLCLGLLVGGFWYAYVRLADPGTFLEIASEETGNWTSYHVRPFYYYWSFFIQSGIWTIPAFLSLIYPYFKKRINQRRLYKFSFMWTILALLLLSVIPEKKPRYLVPVLFPLALNTMLVINYLVNNKRDKFSKFFHYLHYSIIMLVCIGVLFSPLALGMAYKDIWLIHLLLSVCALVIGYYTFYQLSHKNFKNLIWSNVMLIIMITLIGLGSTELFKKNQDYKYLNSKEFENQVKPNFYYKSLPPEVIWEFGKKTTPWSGKVNKESSFRVLVSKNNLKEFQSKYPDILDRSTFEVFDRNYYRERERKHERFITYVYEIVPSP